MLCVKGCYVHSTNCVFLVNGKVVVCKLQNDSACVACCLCGVVPVWRGACVACCLCGVVPVWRGACVAWYVWRELFID